MGREPGAAQDPHRVAGLPAQLGAGRKTGDGRYLHRTEHQARRAGPGVSTALVGSRRSTSRRCSGEPRAGDRVRLCFPSRGSGVIACGSRRDLDAASQRDGAGIPSRLARLVPNHDDVASWPYFDGEVASGLCASQSPRDPPAKDVNPRRRRARPIRPVDIARALSPRAPVLRALGERRSVEERRRQAPRGADRQRISNTRRLWYIERRGCDGDTDKDGHGHHSARSHQPRAPGHDC